MTSLLSFFVLLPLLGFFFSLLAPSKKEELISRISVSTVSIHMVYAILFLTWWIFAGHTPLNEKDIILFQSTAYEFFIDFYFDKITATYLFAGAFLTFLVTLCSRVYLHREKGYKRFFNIILLFYLGYNLIIFSGNMETLVIGWEILGISSFLLISFYRERYLPVKNAVKVFSIYRIGDVGLILAMWMGHHLWHENITFVQLNNYGMVHQHLQSHTLTGVSISLMILLTAAAKSAQFPFSSWLPRAMEGPTPSSAIFYGALSVHLGAFLLLRTFLFWEHQLSVRILTAALGMVTALVATGIARVQSSVKNQIAYASVAQTGLIFIEVSAGFENLALFHFAGNAFLRTYQLLVSPSVVSYHIREQFYNFSPRAKSFEDSFPKYIENTFYMLCIKEWNLDSAMYRFLWNPIKMMGNKLNILNFTMALSIFIPMYGIGLFCVYHKDLLTSDAQSYLPFAFSFIGLMMVLKSFTEREKSRMSWLLVIMNHFWVALAISFNEQFGFDHVHLYLSGVVASGLLGYLCLNRLKILEGNIGLDQFHGHASKHPKIALVFLLCCLALSGFPITPTFIGEDLIFSHIHENQVILASVTALSLIIDGLAVIRIYARVFLGPHSKSIDGMAYRSS
jgi:NADH-quinone oxidoreductase subunit L